MDNIMTAEARREACKEMQFQWGEDAHYWDYAQAISELLQQSLEHVEGLVGPDTAAGPLRQLVEPVAIQSYPNAQTWRDVMDDTFSAGTIWPISSRLQDALLYGLFGVTPLEIAPEERARWIESLIGEVTNFAKRGDVVSLGEISAPITRISGLAASRYALDAGKGEIDIHSMSVLGSVSEGRVRNLMSGAGGALERGPEGGIVAMSALTWLQKRDSFLHSIWAEEEVGPVIEDMFDTPLDPNKTLFVPVARDGSIFNPDLRRGGSFQIGAKGFEQNFDTFEEALAAINTLSVPRWRRPNDKGHWGIVSGVAWQRIERP